MQTILVQHAKRFVKTIIYNFYIIRVYDPLYSAIHPMKYLESDVMWYTSDMLPIYAQSINTIYSTRLFILCCASSSGVQWNLYNADTIGAI